jgi:hypothetical protein
MTLGNMRELGVQRLLVSCLNHECQHEALLDVSRYWDDTTMPSFIPQPGQTGRRSTELESLHPLNFC